MKIETLFDIGDKVVIDNCKAIVPVVIGIMIRDVKTIEYQVSWIQDGVLRDPWVQEWRLDKWDA